MRRLIAILLWVAVAPIAAARSPIEAKLVIPSTKILPGVPFEMSIEVHNWSATTVHVATCGRVQSVPIDGTVNYWCNRSCMEAQTRPIRGRDAEAVIASGQTKTLALTIRGLLTGPELEDSISLSKAAGHTVDVTVQLCLLERKDDQPIITNAVAIQLLEPAGSDARVWQLMNKVADDAWTPRDADPAEAHGVWAQVISEYPDSNYMPYAVLAMSGGVDQATLDRIQETIRRFPDSPVIALLRGRAQSIAKALAKPPE